MPAQPPPPEHLAHPEHADDGGRTTRDGSIAGPGRTTAPGRLRLPRRKPLIVTAAVAAALVVGAGAADVAVEHAARGRIVDAAACRLKTTGPVSADLTSTFAGLRVVTGNLGSVHIAARNVRRDGTDLDVAADLHDVTTDGTTSGGSATATIGYGELQKRLTGLGDDLSEDVEGLKAGSDSGGLVLTGRVGRFGLPVTVHTRLTTAKDSLTVTPTTVTVLGQDVPVGELASMPGASGVADRLGPHTVRLPELPAGVRLSGAHADAEGLTLALAVDRGPAGRGAGCRTGAAGPAES